ncbi:transposase [Variovorax sp. J22R24]|uniref:transposase n=1 Tax=Variovorax gracilis TaxID=3053502 RepID=UPI0025764B1F|nr:transposase [Variovorax sp. J22R24]MDM0108404.1 transposase [Variovorax sp. J22R24]
MKGTALVGYNVQTVVDARHHLIVAHEVTATGSDRAQLSKMAKAAREAMDSKRLNVVADRGYYGGPELKACADAGLKAYVPKVMTSNSAAQGRFSKHDFIYIARDDEDQCPAGERAIHRFAREEGGLLIHLYWTSACSNCLIKNRCTTSSYRRIWRWEHEEVVEAAERRLARNPEMMKLRKRPWSTFSARSSTGWVQLHFLTRGSENVATEMSLNVLAYNMKRVITLLGIGRTIKAMRLAGA